MEKKQNQFLLLYFPALMMFIIITFEKNSKVRGESTMQMQLVLVGLAV